MSQSVSVESDLVSLSPSPALVTRYRASGHWRTTTILDDLERWAKQTPEAAALIGHRPDGTVRSVSYAELASAVEGYAAALRGLGVGPGGVVSTWLPTRWELGALMLACWQVGAAVAPMMTTFGPREVERMIARVGSSVCITVDSAAGVDHGAALAAMAARLPALRHQVVLGDPGAGQIGFADRFEAVAGRVAGSLSAAAGPDAVSLILFTSGTTGEPKAVVHSLNTVGAGAASYPEMRELGPVVFSPHSLSHVAAIGLFTMTLRTGAADVLMEQWDPVAAAGLLDELGVSLLFAAPVFHEQLLEVLPDALPAHLRALFAVGMAPPRALVEQVAHRWSRPLRSYWGMTETNGIFTRAEDPEDWAAHSIGRPGSGMQVELCAEEPEPVTAARPGRMRVRGPSVCLAITSRDGGAARITAEHDDGWYDTGDLAAPDGRGGFTVLGRAVDRVGGAFMIPTDDVEGALREHPAIADAALIETYDHGEPIPCAVITAITGAAAPGLAQIRTFLLEKGMTEWFVPRRLELLDALPRNAMGKVEKARLRDRYSATHSNRAI